MASWNSTPWRFDVAQHDSRGRGGFAICGFRGNEGNRRQTPEGIGLVSLTKQPRRPMAARRKSPSAIGKAGIDHEGVSYSAHRAARGARSPRRPDLGSTLPPPRSCARSPSNIPAESGTVMLTKITGGEIIDPVNGRLGKGDLWIEARRIVETPAGGRPTRPSTRPAASWWPAPSTSTLTSAAAM